MTKRSPKKRTPPPLATWVPGVSTGELARADLIAEFLLRTESIPGEEAARLAGVSLSTIRKWRTGLFRNVGTLTQRRLRIFLARREIAACSDERRAQSTPRPRRAAESRPQ